MKNKRIFLSILAIWGLVMSCNLPSGTPTQVPPSQNQATTVPTDAMSQAATATTSADTAAPATSTTEPIVVVVTATFSPSATPCYPMVVANTPVNVRSGPGLVYDIIGALVQGGSAKIAGKNAESTWWYIEFAGGVGGHGWVGATVVTASCVPNTLNIIAAPPTPILPTLTPTLVIAPLFAVTSVHYAVTTWNDAGHTNCPRIVAAITANGAGTVEYHWIRSDGPGPHGTLVFGAAGTQAVTADWALGSTWAPPPAEWMGIYIDSPNHQNFGHANMPACTHP